MTWVATVIEPELRSAVSAPFEQFLTSAARSIQDRTGAMEAAVPADELAQMKLVRSG